MFFWIPLIFASSYSSSTGLVVFSNSLTSSTGVERVPGSIFEVIQYYNQSEPRLMALLLILFIAVVVLSAVICIQCVRQRRKDALHSRIVQQLSEDLDTGNSILRNTTIEMTQVNNQKHTPRSIYSISENVDDITPHSNTQEELELVDDDYTDSADDIQHFNSESSKLKLPAKNRV